MLIRECSDVFDEIHKDCVRSLVFMPYVYRSILTTHYLKILKLMMQWRWSVIETRENGDLYDLGMLPFYCRNHGMEMLQQMRSSIESGEYTVWSFSFLDAAIFLVLMTLCWVLRFIVYSRNVVWVSSSWKF
ncbi:hypothetical protein DPEC_G00023930 [Dallia pectoralis]|uniref:Uncharacterized protein n=1 Tax=Dallia pectoralis TaxID=75939 RepID=A0ACC2HH31_DALPE|nr:hypothetical protein DPEC_G00023930 [Dallia pectoralis]